MKRLKWFALVLMLFPVFAQAQTTATPVVKEVQNTEVKALLEKGAVMIDVREVDEVAALAYDMEGVVNIPLSQLAKRLSEIPKDKTVIMACRSGNRSRKATMMLLQKGFSNVFNLQGGIKAWQANGLPVKKNQ